MQRQAAKRKTKEQEQFEFFKNAWGITKAKFIKNLVDKGQPRLRAEHNWRKERQRLRDHGVQFPRAHLIDQYLQNVPDPEGFAFIDDEEQEEILKWADKVDRDERIKKAKKQHDDFRNKYNEGVTAEDEEEQTTMAAAPQMEPPKMDTNEKPPNQKKRKVVQAGFEDPATYGGGGEAAGEAETRGGQGGGLAGAGNNTLFKGFGKSTVPDYPEDYSYVDYYTRPFATHTLFPEPSSHGATFRDTSKDWPDKSSTNWNNNRYRMSCDHGGILIPYTIMEASMLTADWNKPPDHLAYKVEEFGFDIPNLRLSIMNNDRASVEEVAPAPPADARMWMFIDTNNDYGHAINHEPADIAHNKFFSIEDIVTTEVGDYNLPVVGERTWLTDGPTGNQILTDRRWYQPDAASTDMTADDPNTAYNLKRHPGYHEFTLSNASLGMSYKCNAPKIRLPSSSMDSIMSEWRMPDAGQNMWNQDDVTQVGTAARQQIHQWQTVQDEYLSNQGNPEDDDAKWQTQGLVAYYLSTIVEHGNQINTTNPMNTAEQNNINALGSQQYMRAPEPVTGMTLGIAIPNIRTRNSGRPSVSDNGKVHAKHFSKRPPIFMFGVHKELEYRSSGAEIWRYAAYGQINYWAKIRWYVQPSRYPIYHNIGLGGVLNVGDITDSVDGRKKNWVAQKAFRHTSRPIFDSTNWEAIEIPNSQSTYITF